MIRKIIWGLTVCWMVIIFLFSSQPGEVSRITSGKVLEKASLIEHEQVATTSDSSVLQLQHMIRKWAHKIIYFTLGVLVTLSIVAFKYRGFKSYLLAWGFTILYAASDEFHQTFVPERGASWSDVRLDSLSSLLAVLTTMAAVELLRHTHPKWLHKIVR